MKMVKSLVAVAVAFGSLILPSGLSAHTVPNIVEYRGVEYIDTNGRYFNTGYKPSGGNNFVEFAYKYLTVGLTENDNFAFGYYNYPEAWYSGLNAAGTAFNDGGVFLHQLEGDHMVLVSRGFTSTKPLECYLCRRIQYGVQGSCSFRVYSCKIGNDEGLQRDYVPVVDCDGKIGLFNTLDGTLDEGLGKGVMTCGARTDVVYFRLNEYEAGVDVKVDGPENFVDAAGHIWEAVSWCVISDAGIVAEGTGNSATFKCPGDCTIKWQMFCADDLRKSIVRYREIAYVESTAEQALDTGFQCDGTGCRGEFAYQYVAQAEYSNTPMFHSPGSAWGVIYGSSFKSVGSRLLAA